MIRAASLLALLVPTMAAGTTYVCEDSEQTVTIRTELKTLQIGRAAPVPYQTIEAGAIETGLGETYVIAGRLMTGGDPEMLPTFLITVDLDDVITLHDEGLVDKPADIGTGFAPVSEIMAGVTPPVCRILMR